MIFFGNFVFNSIQLFRNTQIQLCEGRVAGATPDSSTDNGL